MSPTLSDTRSAPADPHTPGNWSCTEDGRFPIVIVSDHKSLKDLDGTLICAINMSLGARSFQEQLANGRLMAAGPDMLMALKMAAQADIEQRTLTTLESAFVHAALKKVKGPQ